MAHLVRPPPPPHHHVGPHDSADGGYVLKQLTRAVSKYMARHPSLRLSANRTSTGRVCSGHFKVDKDLPPLPSGGDPLSSEDEELHPSLHSSPSNTSVSVTRPLTARSWISQSSWLRRRISTTHSNSGTSTSDSSADYSHAEATTALEYYSTSSRRALSSSVAPEERGRSNPETESTISTSPSTNSLPSSRISASVVIEPNSDSDASTSGYLADYRSSASASQYYSSSSDRASLLSIAQEEQSQSKPEDESAALAGPSKNPRPPLGPRLETNLNVVTSTSGSSADSHSSAASTASEYFTVPSGRSSSWYLVQPEEGIRSDSEAEPTGVPFNEDSDPSASKPPVEERASVYPYSLTVTPLEVDLRSDPTMPPVPPSPPRKHQPPSTAKKRKRAEVQTRPLSPDPTSIPSGPSKKRKSLNPISSTSSWSPEDEAPSSLPSQSVGDGRTLSAPNLPEDWICWTLQLTLEELFKGGEYIYRVKSRMLSGEPRTQYVQVDVMPGWAPGTRISFPDAGNEHTPGLFQTVVFVVEQADQERFRRRERGNLECIQEISEFDASSANGARAPRSVVGLDGKVIEFFPPEGVISPGQETVIEGEGMYQRSHGEVVGRGNLIIRWNITP
ncbi:hypothetical protein FRC01_001293 [Tulasnella sp. 417]|nr:hypothetical protein FRC01_001293 [Tulasnella sp. 417]